MTTYCTIISRRNSGNQSSGFETKEDTIGNIDDKEVNVLRDKLEKACAKISRAKCKRACKKAFQKTCENYNCARRFKRYYNKDCDRQCKYAFEVRGSSYSE